MVTVREHLEAIRALAAHPDQTYRNISMHAVEALAILDKAGERHTTRNQLGGEMRWRIVPDPEPSA